MSSLAVAEFAIDFVVVSTVILMVALLLVAFNRSSAHRDTILKLAIAASVLVPIGRAASRSSDLLPEEPRSMLAIVPPLPTLVITPTEPLSRSPLDVAVVVWLAVVAIAIAWLIFRNLAFMRSVAMRCPLTSRVWVESLNRLGAVARLSVLPDGFPSPFCLSGEICIPAWMVDSLAEEEREAVLAHEIEHLRRRDAHWMFFLDVLCAVLFVQPLLLFARARLRTLVEQRADGAAAIHVGSGVPLAEVLLKVSERMSRRDLRPELALLRHRSPLLERVQRLLVPPLNRRLSPWAIVLQLSVALFVAASVPALEVIEHDGARPPLRIATVSTAVLTGLPASAHPPFSALTTRTDAVDVAASVPALEVIEHAGTVPPLGPATGSTALLTGPPVPAHPPRSASTARTDAVDALISVLRSDESSHVRYAAAESLGRRQDRRAVSALRQAAGADPDVNVRSAAVEAIQRIER